MKLRFAKQEDTHRLLEIYAPYVENSVVSFEYEIPTLDEFEKRRVDIQKEYPYLVCEVDGVIAGYAYAHRHMERAAYQWNVELSLYLDEVYTGQHSGSKLLKALLAILKLQHLQNVYSCITIPNPKSEAIHRKFGFTTVGTFLKSGYKFDEWHDVMWMEKRIGNEEEYPCEWFSVTNLNPEDIKRILND